MKKLLSILLTAILIFSMTACQSSGQISCPADDEPDKINAPGSNGASKPTSKEPPELKILDNTCLGIVANKGTYSWTYDNGDGTPNRCLRRQLPSAGMAGVPDSHDHLR